MLREATKCTVVVVLLAGEVVLVILGVMVVDVVMMMMVAGVALMMLVGSVVMVRPTFPVNSSPGAGHCVRVRTVPMVAPTLGGARRFSQTEQPPNRQRNQGQRTGIDEQNSSKLKDFIRHLHTLCRHHHHHQHHHHHHWHHHEHYPPHRHHQHHPHHHLYSYHHYTNPPASKSENG
ncbi:transcription factor MafB-like [Gadus chalcogrammus]|uniref:transcription factor MafB-like n=1 Tax=Gadus chalcogrammus TaxID=1042646 RepID=UPI0024C4BA56|nr:transcription factor MafB-like [Gadus chalcogrammus]